MTPDYRIHVGKDYDSPQRVVADADGQGGYRCDPEFVTVFYKEASTVTKGKSYFKISSVDDEREVEELAKEHISSTDREGISKEYSELLLGDVWPECKDKELSSVQVYRLINRIEDNTYCSEVFYFGKDGKKNQIDIRVVHKGDDVILRIRDNCTAFNPTERASAMEPGEMGKNIGIGMVYRIAREVSYQNLLGLNVLTMRI